MLIMMKEAVKEMYQNNKGPFYLSTFGLFFSFFGTIIYMNIFYNASMEIPSGVNTAPNESTYQEIVWYEIFIHNFMILIPIIIGIISLGFISFLYICFQGNLLGSSIFFLSKELPVSLIMKYTIFHGIFEMLAVIIVGTLALKPLFVIFGHIFFNKPFFKRKDIKEMIVLFILFILLLLVAALIEGLITVNL
ncbi:stage II sporulation protein M [Evansella sp. AB-P1]|uniref:stage II sporulation protein M n=1 Tax=Evansella sp. AB-P1 TaxID=3037653 RepID=UPI00241D8153|nr:stage II sporulation protein M [Evansella sp. AB-P1]MDG5790186.1 stage II sporulation protein M [Evansella sp. AB-P1]